MDTGWGGEQKRHGFTFKLITDSRETEGATKRSLLVPSLGPESPEMGICSLWFSFLAPTSWPSP